MRLGWKIPLERLSATSMSTFVQCPEMFRQKYLLGTKDGMHGARFMGIVDHAVTEAILSRTSPWGTGTLEIQQLYASEWNKALDEHGAEVQWKDTIPQKQFEIGVKMMSLYASQVLANVTPVACEERVEFRIPGVPSKVIGYVDILEATQVREKKTTGRKTTKPQGKWRFQGLIYQAALGMPVRWDVVTSQVTPQLFTADEYPDLYLPLRDIKQVTQMIRDTAWHMNECYQRYGRDQAWPTTGIFGDWMCSYCPIGSERGNGTCPAWTTR